MTRNNILFILIYKQENIIFLRSTQRARAIWFDKFNTILVSYGLKKRKKTEVTK